MIMEALSVLTMEQHMEDAEALLNAPASMYESSDMQAAWWPQAVVTARALWAGRLPEYREKVRELVRAHLMGIRLYRLMQEGRYHGHRLPVVDNATIIRLLG